MATPQKEEAEMSFLDHLEALRWHLIRSLLSIVVFSVLAFLNKSFLFDTLIFGPKKADFITFRALCKASAKLADWLPFMFNKTTLCIGQNMPPLQNIEMAGQFLTHIMVSLVAGLVIAFPYVFYEIWSFVRPALYPGEKSYTRGSVFSTSLLFMLGVSFGYFIIAPLSVNFFLSYSVSPEVQNLPTLGTYISTITTVVLACGFVFQLPIVVYFFTKIGILSPALLRKLRRHAIIGALVLSAIITPPDVFSQLLVTLPIIVLYEISIFISARVVKSAEKEV
jgi:sec-independent protein translocase protein TatC